jgi:hypothetical protein
MDEHDEAWLDSFKAGADGRIPEDAIIEGFVSVVAWTTPDGESNWALYDVLGWRTSGIVGLLQMAAFHVMAKSTPALGGAEE